MWGDSCVYFKNAFRETRTILYGNNNGYRSYACIKYNIRLNII